MVAPMTDAPDQPPRPRRPDARASKSDQGTARPRGVRGGAGRVRAQTDKPFRPPAKRPPRRPPLPDERPFIPREAWRDLRATVPATALDDVVKAVGAAAEALDAGDSARALELLAWAKQTSPRTPTIREALGIALYGAERYPEAQSELLAYRRLTGSHDQNHLLADCARAAGRSEKVTEYVDEMISADVTPERVAEGLIVLAGARADAGDLEGGLAALQRVDLDPDHVQPWHPRLWYAAADILQRLGRTDEARDYFEAVDAVDDEFGDVGERLAALDN
jgi:tetratricopeptide (TPR) repeat protein